MQQVDHYGLHWEGSVAWLVQGRGASNFVGLKGQPPVRVTTKMCNHLIPAAAPIPDRIQWQRFMEFFHDPLVQAMLPLPHKMGSNSFYLADPDNTLLNYVTVLSRMSSPIQPVTKLAWNMKPRDLEKELTTSNLQPLVIAQTSTKDQELVDSIAEMSRVTPRACLIVGEENVVVPPPMSRLTTSIDKVSFEDLVTLPLEGIGAALLRRYARREPLDAPMESRQIRRDRQIKERTKGNG